MSSHSAIHHILAFNLMVKGNQMLSQESPADFWLCLIVQNCETQLDTSSLKED